MASPEETNSPQYTTNSSTPDKSESPKVIQDSETPEYLDKLNEYYRLKNMYESSYKDKKTLS